MAEPVIKSVGVPFGGGCMLLVHGGAWAIPDVELAAYREAMAEAVAVGREALLRGDSAIAVVAQVVACQESSGVFDAGSGAVLTAEGSVELDAGIMDGSTLSWGSVGAVRRLANPVEVARTIASRGGGQVRLMVGPGAEEFASRHGHELIENGKLISDRERARLREIQQQAGYHTSHPFLADEVVEPAQTGNPRGDEGRRVASTGWLSADLPGSDTDHPRGTVGCVARDARGALASATSTGGTPNRVPGRVGDSPLPGCGFYATAECAASATGWGEGIATVLLCGSVVSSVAAGLEVEEAIRARLIHLHRNVVNTDGHGATAGLIALDGSGGGAVGYSTPRMARAGWSQDGEPWVLVA